MKTLSGKQRGFSTLGWMLVIFVVGLFALVGLKIGPVYLDNLQIQAILKDVANDEGAGQEDPHAITLKIFKRLTVNNISYLKSEDVVVTKEGSKTIISVQYDVQRPVVFNIEFLLHFKNQEIVKNP